MCKERKCFFFELLVIFVTPVNDNYNVLKLYRKNRHSGLKYKWKYINESPSNYWVFLSCASLMSPLTFDMPLQLALHTSEPKPCPPTPSLSLSFLLSLIRGSEDFVSILFCLTYRPKETFRTIPIHLWSQIIYLHICNFPILETDLVAFTNSLSQIPIWKKSPLSKPIATF